MPFTLAALRTELQTDPTGLGYTTNPVTACDVVNLARASIQISRGVIKTSEILRATVFSELNALSAALKQLYGFYISAGQLDVDGPDVTAAFQAMFGPGTATRANLVALRTRNGSRAEQLFGAGTVVPLERVREAMA